MNDMIINPNRFQAKIISCDKKRKQFDLNMSNSIIIWSVDSATFLGIEIDNKLNFEKHISTIISFYIFSSIQYSLLYIYFYIVIYIITT